MKCFPEKTRSYRGGNLDRSPPTHSLILRSLCGAGPKPARTACPLTARRARSVCVRVHWSEVGADVTVRSSQHGVPTARRGPGEEGVSHCPEVGTAVTVSPWHD